MQPEPENESNSPPELVQETSEERRARQIRALVILYIVGPVGLLVCLFVEAIFGESLALKVGMILGPLVFTSMLLAIVLGSLDFFSSLKHGRRMRAFLSMVGVLLNLPYPLLVMLG